ncbi:MAG: phytanoyl-CoA dioxygenase family protein [Cephaloticoccus sp.]|nr:phytanoyl-CoA dioxygenase family protein [Cephaloticoccus sp.]
MSSPTPAQQRAFFEAFGFLKLPGLLKAEVATITAEFEAVFPQLGLKHDGTKRTMIVPFVDQRPGLCALLDHPGVLAAVGNVLGDDFNYMGSDGNYYSGETTWHRDSLTPSNSYIKLALYLDPVTRDSGCLRVVPGSHTDLGMKQWHDPTLRDAENQWGRHQRDLPAQALESEPGDVLLFNHRLLHASFGGGPARRMFTMNLGRRAKTATEIDDLIAYGDQHFYHYGLRTPYGQAMTENAPAARLVHLTQLPRFWDASVARSKARTAS